MENNFDDREIKQKSFFKEIKENLNVLNSNNDFNKNIKSLFQIYYIVKERAKEHKDKKYENTEIFKATEKLLESASNDFKNINKDKILYAKMLSQYVFFRELLNENENNILKDIPKEEYQEYIKCIMTPPLEKKVKINIKIDNNQLSF